jgi:hypothetical protein|tara:strand:- start:2141 stop:2269 length:129 start_codon:yes stop_codon:yes gene_type:complete
MTESEDKNKEVEDLEDSKLDAVTATILILILTSAAVFWVSNQ